MDGLIVVHGAFVPGLSEPPLSGFLLWGEGPGGASGLVERHDPAALDLRFSPSPPALAQPMGNPQRGAVERRRNQVKHVTG